MDALLWDVCENLPILACTGDLNPAFTAGPFRLTVGEIRAYLPEPQTPRIVHISSAGALLPCIMRRHSWHDCKNAV